MAIGQRIKFFRNKKGMTQKQLGEMLGFLGRTSDVRMAQYESEARIPKQELIKKMAYLLDVSPSALTIPEIDTYLGLIHTLFALEDIYGLKVKDIDGKPYLYLDHFSTTYNSFIEDMLRSWLKQSQKLKNEEISKEEYDEWRYKYPDLDDSPRWAKVPSKAVSDMLSDAFKKEEKKKTKKKK